MIKWLRQHMTLGDYLIIGTALLLIVALCTGWALGTVHFFWKQPERSSSPAPARPLYD